MVRSPEAATKQVHYYAVVCSLFPLVASASRFSRALRSPRGRRSNRKFSFFVRETHTVLTIRSAAHVLPPRAAPCNASAKYESLRCVVLSNECLEQLQSRYLRFTGRFLKENFFSMGLGGWGGRDEDVMTREVVVVNGNFMRIQCR